MTRGGITGSLVLFALPMTASNMMQQLYNIADTLIVGRAVGSFGMSVVLTVISLGVRLCGGSAAIASLASTVRGLGFVTAWSDGDFAEMLFKLIGQVLVVISNYFFSKFVIFRKKK